MMEFRLVYHGPLPAASDSGKKRRSREKHLIRRVLHGQLRELWFTHPLLKADITPIRREDIAHSDNTTPQQRALAEAQIMAVRPPAQTTADRFARFGYRFLPLIEARFNVACSLDILFLRRDEPGSVIQTGGDIDNRMKTLFDALRVPQREEEIEGFSPQDDENPFFCVLEDDQLITEVKVTTDRLLTPLGASERMNDVHLVIRVATASRGSW